MVAEREPQSDMSEEEKEALRTDREPGVREDAPVSVEGERPAVEDPAVLASAVEEARKRAVEAAGRPEAPGGSVDFAPKAGTKLYKAGRDGVFIAVQIAGAMGFLGYHTARPFARGALKIIDWLGQKLDKLGDRLIDKNLFVLKWLINPAVWILDKSAKALGLDKTLAEHLKKNAEDRRKLAEKIFKDYMETQKKAEKKADDAAAKAKRRKALEDTLGPDVAATIVEDVDAIAAAAEPAAAPAVEIPKAA